ncbi:MAG: hypothetical protein SVR08_17395 [Spirochaetota bacterium]|nr:hypothetical protein [Spirochaetota bacterium]
MKKTKLRIFLVLIAIACFSSVFLNCAEDGKSGEDAVGVQGEQGEQGPQGDVGATGPQGPQGDPGESEYPRLYVVGYTSDNICVFHNAGVAGWSYGDIYPDREIYYDLDSLSEGPFGLFLDKVYNELYVADLIANRILVFEEPDGIDAESAPDRIIWAEIGTTFTEFNPGDVLVEGNKLYISNSLGNVDDAAIIIISDANIADGENGKIDNIRELRGASTTLNRPYGLAFGDTKLFVANYDDNSVLRFENPWVLSVNNPDSPPSEIITDASIDAPTFLCLDEVNDELYVTNYDNDTITVIQDATQASPSISRTITNFPSEPTGIAVDAEYDRLYVALSDGSIYIWKKASEVSGNVTIDAVPTRMILSDNTQLVSARDIILDTEE